MSDKGWKAAERRIARKLGGRRIPVTGEREGIDVDAGPFVYQLKVRRGMPKYLSDWLEGIRRQAGNGEARTGVVIWKSPRAHDDGAVVLLSLADWIALHGD